jgi:GNAT superfamily N-acetyltransferase
MVAFPPQIADAGMRARCDTSPFVGVDVRLARSAADREAVYRLRYRVYVEELGFQQVYADHERKTVQDPLDATAIVLLAEVGGEVVGTVRTNIASDSDLGRYAALHRLHELRGVARSQITMTSKLIVDARYRQGRIARQLVHAIFRIAVMHSVVVDFIDCEGRLLPLYERLGYRRTSEQPFEHPELGPRYPLCLWTDAAYLTRVGSAFVKNLQ